MKLSFPLLFLLVAPLSGCILDPFTMVSDTMTTAIMAAGPSDAEIKADHDAYMKGVHVAEYQTQTCEQITAFWPERKAAVTADETQWGGKVALEAAEQVISQKGCTVPQTSIVATSPAARTTLVERDPKSFAAIIANPPAQWGPLSPKGLRKSTLAQWVSRETPQKYEGRSCDYLNQALARSHQLEAMSDIGAQAWGAHARVAIEKTLNNRSCPEWTTNGSGRTGVQISQIDPIKAPQLNMPVAGASVEGLIPGGNGEKAGLQFADVVVAVGSEPVADDVDYLVSIGRLPTGSSALLKVWRANTFINVPVLVGPSTVFTATKVTSASKSLTGVTTLQDVQVAAVSQDYAKAVGLQEPKGAWVIEIAKGGLAERAGLRPLDVILEVSGQEISSPEDLNAIGAKMRKGYNAPVVVWRDRTKKDLKMALW